MTLKRNIIENLDFLQLYDNKAIEVKTIDMIFKLETMTDKIYSNLNMDVYDKYEDVLNYYINILFKKFKL